MTSPGDRGCRVCGADAQGPRFVVREMMFGFGDSFEYRQCTECGSVQIADVPADLARYYPRQYYSFRSTADGRGPIKRLIRNLRNEHALFGLGWLGAWLESRFPYPELRSISRVRGLRRDFRILDVGCGGGVLLRELSERGFRHLLGIDPYIDADLDHGRGLRILKRHLHEVDAEWDLVMFHHSLEHVSDPRATLELARERLAAGGTVLVRVPVVPCAAFERYGAHWVALDAPRHVFVPSVEGMRRMAGHAGLVLTSMVHDSTALQFWGSEQYLRGAPLSSAESFSTNPSAFPPATVAAWRREAEHLNSVGRGDQAAFYLMHAGDAEARHSGDGSRGA